MEIVNKDLRNGFVAAFLYVIKVMWHCFYVSFLETCKSYGLCPTGLNIRKTSFIEFKSDYLIIFWKETLLSAENNLLEGLCVGICCWEYCFTETNNRKRFKILKFIYIFRHYIYMFSV